MSEAVARFKMNERDIANHSRLLKLLEDNPQDIDNFDAILVQMREEIATGWKIVHIPKTEPERIDYETYIQSRHWADKSKAAKERADYHCQVCNGAEQLTTHHRTYERLGCERDEDLIVLCWPCHSLFHDNGKLKR